MKLRVNDQQTEVRSAVLSEALVELGYRDAVVATAINGTFVPKSLRSETKLNAGDQLDIVAPMQGG